MDACRFTRRCPQYEAEVLFTGQDYRLHLWRMGAGDTREPQLVEIGAPVPLVPPVAEPGILRYLDPEYSAALLEESLSDELPHKIQWPGRYQ